MLFGRKVLAILIHHMEKEVSQFQIGSELTYDVRTSTIFLFQITAATTSHQQIVFENLLFDPTRLISTLGLMRIGTGRDAADVAFATLTGQAILLNKNVWANFSTDVPDLSLMAAVSIA